MAVASAVLYFTRQISRTAAIIIGLLALVFVITSFVRFWTIY